MPLVGFRPTKARLIIEDGADSILVMKVALSEGDGVELFPSGTLAALGGVLRVRRKNDAHNGNGRDGARTTGTLVYVGETDDAALRSLARYQINIAMPSGKFDALLKVAVSGRLPTKFFIDAGERVSRHETVGMGYELRSGKRTKVWNTRSHRSLPITRFTMILPIELGDAPAEATSTPAPTESAPAPFPVATASQLVELVDELSVLQGETRYTILALVGVVGVIALAALAISVVLMMR
ncbi:MAG TPA: hypothetical protein VMV45_17485 [Casimicrobiaceae bacterium]|nr:hypothetical protein [Casimicrobiaceae bacterium]